MLLTARACPICESTDVRVFRAACRDRLHETPGTWDVLRCRACGVRFTDHRGSDEEMVVHYPAEYNVSAPRRAVRETRAGSLIRGAAIWPYWLKYGNPDRLPAPFGNRRALDVGCGPGNDLLRLSGRGWEAHGLDFNADAVQLARSRAPDAFVRHGTLDNFQAPGRFAYIALHHALEHVKQPQDVLRRCYELLEDGGLLSVSVPNIDSLEARLFRTRWRGLDIPRHLVHFSRSTLAQLVRQNGFRVTMVRPALFASSLSESILLALPMGIKRRTFRSSRIRRALYYLAMFPACISYVAGNHPVIELEATKPQ